MNSVDIVITIINHCIMYNVKVIGKNTYHFLYLYICIVRIMIVSVTNILLIVAGPSGGYPQIGPWILAEIGQRLGSNK